MASLAAFLAVASAPVVPVVVVVLAVVHPAEASAHPVLAVVLAVAVEARTVEEAGHQYPSSAPNLAPDIC